MEIMCGRRASSITHQKKTSRRGSFVVEARAALYTFRQPGIYVYLNHMLIEAVELGALAHFKVEGQWNDDLMKQVSSPQPIVAVEVPQEKSH